MPLIPGRSYCVSELLTIIEEDLAERIKHGRWGRWVWDAKCRALWYDEHGDGRNENSAYWVPVDELEHKGKAEDWIWHLSEKGWVQDDDLGSFIRAITDLNDAEIISFSPMRGGC